MITQCYFAVNYGISAITYIHILKEHCTIGDIHLYDSHFYYGVVQACIGGV